MTEGDWDFAIVNGTVALDSGVFPGDIRCAHGKVVALGERGMFRRSPRRINAEGLLVLPGGIDVHTHFDEPFMNCVTADDFESGGRAAFAGGITSHIDFAYQYPGESLHQAVANWHAKAEGRAVADYGLHIVVTDASQGVVDEVPAMVREGYSSFKVFMTYEGLRAADSDLLRLFKAATSAGGRVSVHAEHADISALLCSEFIARGDVGPRWHPISRPVESECEATFRALALARVANAPIYIVHVSSGQAADIIREARTRGQSVVAETSIAYLVLTEEVYQGHGFEAAKYVCSPPLRPLAEQERLWQLLQDGTLQIVGSDHDSFTWADRRKLGAADFTKIPNGIEGVQHIRPLLWSEGVQTGRLSLERFVAVTATNPAKAFGLWPRKGGIVPGGDADFVLWDPAKRYRLGVQDCQSHCDYCVYEGREVTGGVVMTVSRGEVVFDGDSRAAVPGRGRFLPRTRAEWV